MTSRLPLFIVVLATFAFGGGRARLGGTLEAAALVKAPSSDPLLADTPLEATLSQLTRSPPCRLGDLSRPAPKTVRLSIKTSIRAADVVQAMVRIKDTPSPYRALFTPVRAVTASGASTVDFELDAISSDFEQVLCHPVLAVGPASFAPSSDRLLANADPGLPRPWLDAIVLRATDSRTAERLVAQRKVQVVLGADSNEGELLYATYLIAQPRLGSTFAQALESSVDRPGLTRFFVRPPARALSTLVPPASFGAKRQPLLDITWPTPARPAPLATPVELNLVFDESVEGHRAVAERLQVKLGTLGYRLKLEALPRRQFRERLTTGPDLALVGVLVPPSPVPALELIAALSNEKVQLDGQPHDALIERASKPAANVFPLFVQGLGVSATRDVQHLTRDSYGLPRLDDVFLAGE